MKFVTSCHVSVADYNKHMTKNIRNQTLLKTPKIHKKLLFGVSGNCIDGGR